MEYLLWLENYIVEIARVPRLGADTCLMKLASLIAGEKGQQMLVKQAIKRLASIFEKDLNHEQS